MQTQPAVFGYATDQLDDDHDVTLGYASVSPMAMITKIVIAQILAALTL